MVLKSISWRDSRLVLPRSKALIDLVQFHRSAYSADRVLEILSENLHNVDQARLTSYLLQSNLTTQRLFGLFFDKLHLSYDRKLEESAHSSAATSRMNASTHEYSNKWRLYYDADMFRNYNSLQTI
jgi:hypothetical protein